MGDPLSVAASVAGLLSLALQSTDTLYQYYTTYRNQDRELARTADHLGELHQSLQTIDEIIRNRKWHPDEHKIVQNVERSIIRCEDVIHELQGQLVKFAKDPTDGWKQKAVVVGRRAAYPFKQSTLVKLGEDVDDFRDNLSVALQSLQLQNHHKIQDDLEEVKQIVKSAQAQHLATSIRQWLRAPDATVEYNIASSKRHADSGRWLTDGSIFANWLRQDNSFLWLYGFAGCGKTVLFSSAVQSAFRHIRIDDKDAVAFFAFTFSDASKQDTSAVLRALLLQLAGQVPGFENSLDYLKVQLHDGTPPVQTLLEYLRDAFTQRRNVYILLDALDESPEETERASVLSMVETLRRWHTPGLHLLVTSRDAPDIRSQLESHQNMANTEWLRLRNDSIDQDIRDYVSRQVDCERELRRWSDSQRQQIKEYLSRHAGGVFRWVECQLYPLKKCPRSEKHLRRCLQTLPESLDKTYETMLCNIGEDSRDDAQRVLALLCYCLRPLSVEEIIEALAVDIDELNCYDEDRKLSGAEDLARLCPGLIEIRSAIPEVEDDGPRQVSSVEQVLLGHFSVQEYLLSSRIKKGAAAAFALSDSTQHAQISKICLLYLSDDIFLWRPFHRDLVQKYPFASYAARFWADHYRSAVEETLQPSPKEIAALLKDSHILDRWTSWWHPDEESDDVYYHKESWYVSSPVYYAAAFGLDDVVTCLLNSGIAVDGLGFRGSALVVASRNGHEKTVQLLLDRGADVNFHRNLGQTALHLASRNGYERIVKILVDKGAEVNAYGGLGHTALLSAASHGYEKIVRNLLDGGANVDDERDFGRTALILASEAGHQKIVQLLLDRGADINARGDFGFTALEMASEKGHEELTQILLERGADPNVSGGSGITALQLAMEPGHEKIIQMLLEKGANINAKAKDGYTALELAVAKGHPTIVQILLDKGADLDAEGKYGHTKLELASARGYAEIVEMLLDRGADVNGRGDDGCTALEWASAVGHYKIVEILLDRGADIKAYEGEVGFVAWKAASEGGHEKIVQLLAEHGVKLE